MKCVQCNSENILENVKVVDRGHYDGKHEMILEVYENPDALIFKSAHSGVVKANICVDCGYVMFSISTADAQKLKKYHDSH